MYVCLKIEPESHFRVGSAPVCAWMAYIVLHEPEAFGLLFTFCQLTARNLCSETLNRRSSREYE